MAASKKKSKVYDLNGDKWRLGTETSKEEKEFALQQYMKLEGEGSVEGKLILIKDARAFIQEKFEKSQPSCRRSSGVLERWSKDSFMLVPVNLGWV